MRIFRIGGSVETLAIPSSFWNWSHDVVSLVDERLHRLSAKTLAHEMRRGGARPRLADVIARVISESKAVEELEVSLVGSIMAHIN